MDCAYNIMGIILVVISMSHRKIMSAWEHYKNEVHVHVHELHNNEAMKKSQKKIKNFF